MVWLQKHKKIMYEHLHWRTEGKYNNWYKTEREKSENESYRSDLKDYEELLDLCVKAKLIIIYYSLRKFDNEIKEKVKV